MSAERPLVGCALHDGADIDACGCPALDSPGAIAYRGLLVKARAEIARLTAELDAARAVPADVEAALDTWAQSEIFAAESEYEPRDSARADANRDILRATIARAISEATATTSTVGGLLATAPVARPISEWHEDHGDALWWRFPIEEPPYCGSPISDDWPGDYHTHWTPIVCPDEPNQRGPLPNGDRRATHRCSKCRGISSHTPGGIPCDECGLVGSMPWGG